MYKNTEHFSNLDELINLKNITNILDAGSGRTSLSYLIKKFPNSDIDAIIYPNDLRKIDSIKESVEGNYNLIEMDICKSNITKKYDLVLAHLLLGEATYFNNTLEGVLKSLLSINSTYYLIYDYKEDNTIDYNYLENYLKENNYTIIDRKEFRKIEPQQFKYFLGETYIEYLIKKEG